MRKGIRIGSGAARMMAALLVLALLALVIGQTAAMRRRGKSKAP